MKRSKGRSDEAGGLNGLFDILFERNPIPMWIFDIASLDFVAVNPATCALYGYSEDELVGKSILGVHPSEDWASVRRNAKTLWTCPEKASTPS